MLPLIIWCRKKRHFACLANNDILRAFTLGTIKLQKNLKQNFGFIKRVDKGEIITVKDLES